MSGPEGGTLDAADITAIVLCGGAGRRFGGVAKPLADLHGKPLLGHVLDRLAGQAARIVLSVGADADGFAAFGVEAIADATPGAGPLGGLASTLPVVRSEWVLTCPADVPCLPRKLVRLLRADAERFGIAVPHDGARRQNLFLLARLERAQALARFFQDGGRAIHRWLDGEGVQSTGLSHCAAAFRNVNSPAELAELRALPCPA